MDERSVDDQTTYVNEDDLLAGRDAAKLLPGVTYQSLMRWARAGHIPSVQYVKGGKRLFRRSDIEALKRSKALTPEHSAASESESTSPDGVLPGQPVLSWPSPETPASASSAGGAA